jgi:hypothetical protein
MVVNEIHSQFHFKDGLIIKQNRNFDIWKWAKQAFGFKGLLFDGRDTCKIKYKKSSFIVEPFSRLIRCKF